MELDIVYKKAKEWFIDHIQAFPDYESQGKTSKMNYKENSAAIYSDIQKRHTEIEDDLAKRIITRLS